MRATIVRAHFARAPDAAAEASVSVLPHATLGGMVASQRPGGPDLPTPAVRLRLRRCGKAPAVPVVLLEGEFDMDTVPEIDRFLRRTFGPFYYRQHLLLDLQGVRLVDSSFVGYLVSLVHHLHVERKELVLSRPVGHVRKVLSLVGLPNLVPVYDSLDEAVAAMRSGELPMIPPAFSTAPVSG
jgi:anti-anti-sigma factor